MYDISQSYHPMVLEIRDTAVELNESLEVFNNRVVLSEIPDTFMKVYISGYTEIEESKLPKLKEYVVDYKTGIVTMDGNTKDNTIVNVSYYGKGIIQYPAERIYSHNPSPEVSGSLQRILDRGEEAITELNVTADLSKRQSHANMSSFFANQDWTRLIQKTQGTGQVNYNSETKGIEINGEVWFKILVRIPIDPESRYWVRAKVKKTVGDGKFFLGAVSLNNDYQEISTDQAKSYNYFGASDKVITSGNTEIIEGSISGYNLTTGSDASKFDPEANFFDLVVIANSAKTADISKTVIEWLEVYRSPKSMHVQDNGSFGGSLQVKGTTSLFANLDMNNTDINRVKVINGEYGNIAKSTDEWLRLNDGDTHTNGVFFGNSIIRTENQIHIGNLGSILLASSAQFNYKGLLVVNGTSFLVSPNANFKANVDIDGTLNVDGISTFQSAITANNNVTVRNGLFDLEHNASGAVMTIKNNSATGDIARFGSVTDAGKFVIANNGSFTTKGNATITGIVTLNNKLSVSGATTLSNTLVVTGATTLSSSLDVEGVTQIVGNIWVGKHSDYGTTPLISLAIGDADTGINWFSDGVLEFKANNTTVVKYDATKFDVLKKINALASMAITGSLTVSDDVTITDTLTAGNTSLGALTIRAGGSATVNGDSTFNGNVDFAGNILNNVDVMNFKDGTFSVSVDDIDKSSGTQDTFHIYSTVGNIKLWRPTYIVGDTTITGNLAISGTVDGVDVSDFKSTFDNHNHDARYLKTSGDSTLNGNVLVGDGFAIYPVNPNGATLGTPTNPFADVYIGPNSLYVDGKQVVSSTADTIDISTDLDQHMSINTSGLGTTRLASGKEVVVYSGQLVTMQSGGNMSVLASGLMSFKSNTNGSGIELVSQSTLGNINITSGNRIEFSATGDISFLQKPKFGGNQFITTADNVPASKITETSSLRFVTDADKTNWNGKVNRSGDIMTGFLTLHADPTQPLHAVTKQYVDAVKQSLDIKDSVRVATTGNITLSGGQTIDGVVLNVGNRVLVKDQTDPIQNGIYIVQSGVWTRAVDMDADQDVSSGAFVFIEEGTVNANMGWVLTTDGVIDIGVTPLTFTQFSGAGQIIAGTGISKSGNTLSIANTGVVAGTYKSVTVNAQGQITGGTNPTTLAGYGITDSVNKNTDNTINGILTVNRLKSAGNSFTVTIPSGSSEIALTHNLGTTNYKVTLGTNSVARHAGWKNKMADSVIIEIDDVHTSDIVVDVILLPY